MKSLVTENVKRKIEECKIRLIPLIIALPLKGLKPDVNYSCVPTVFY